MAQPEIFTPLRTTKINCFGVPIGHEEVARESVIFRNWTARRDPRFKIISTTIQAVDFCGPPSVENVMFIRVLVEAEGTPYTKVVEVVADVVVCLPIIFWEGRTYIQLVQQERLSVGLFESIEVPAGRIDSNESPRLAVLRELEEELGTKFQDSDLIDLNKAVCALPIHQSPGLISEQQHFFAVEQFCESEPEFRALHGRQTGLLTEGERIITRVVPFSELHMYTADGKSFVAQALYQKFRRLRRAGMMLDE